jgi:hypothetical protein
VDSRIPIWERSGKRKNEDQESELTNKKSLWRRVK